MRRNNSTYTLEGEMTSDSTYQVTVTPAYGPARTLYVQMEQGESRLGPGYAFGRYSVPKGYFLVKSAPTSGSYFGRPHREFETACMAANAKARAYGHACRTPLPRSADRKELVPA